VSLELVYTSASRGLKPGSSGFCTIACTRGVSTNLTQQLELLSGYRHLYPPQDAHASQNPVAFSHLTLTLAGRRCHILSRICDAGLDYTNRSNKFAHHVVLDASELPSAGPAWLLAADGFMRSSWPGEPSVLPAGPVVPSGETGPQICRGWQQIAGDAGWGGVLAETAVGPKHRQAVVIVPPGMDVLPLLAESLALLPPPLRWQVSFSTYFTKLPPGVDCQWRCVIDGTPEAVAARRAAASVLVLDLCRPLGAAVGGDYVDAARTGKPCVTTPTVRPPSAALQQTPGTASPKSLPSEDDFPLSEGGIDLSMPPEADFLTGPPPPQFVGVASRPPLSQRHRPNQKPPRRWPWVLGIIALVLISLGVGFIAGVEWTASQNANDGANDRSHPAKAEKPTGVTPVTPKNVNNGKEKVSTSPEKNGDGKPAEKKDGTTKPKTEPQTKSGKDGAKPGKANEDNASGGKGEGKGDLGTNPQPKVEASKEGNKSGATPEAKPASKGNKGTDGGAAAGAKETSRGEKKGKKEKKTGKENAAPKPADNAKTQPIKIIYVSKDLPPPSLAGTNQTNTKEKTIIKGDWPATTSLKLIGGDKALGEKASFELRPPTKNDGVWGCWLIGHQSSNFAIGFAEFIPNKDGLKFKWLTNNFNGFEGDRLCNCLLYFVKDGQAGISQLRRPLSIEKPIRVKNLPSSSTLIPLLKELKEPKAAVLEMSLTIDPKKSGCAIETIEVDKLKHTAMIDKKVKMVVEWDRDKGCITVSCSVPGDSDSDLKVKLTPQRVAQFKRNADRKKADCDTVLRNAQSNQESESVISRCETECTTADSRVEELKSLDSLCTAIKDFRLYPQIVMIVKDPKENNKEYRVVLVETSENK
jgi:hypothetical protein